MSNEPTPRRVHAGIVDNARVAAESGGAVIVRIASNVVRIPFG